MSNVEKMTAWHRAQLGTRECGENNVRYNTAYYGREVCGSAFPWCAAYIWVGFQECGIQSVFMDGGKTAYCPTVMSWAQIHGRWVTDGFREGDLLLYDWDADGVPDHIGYCIAWDGRVATAIEGNCNDMVLQISRTRAQILGAYRPDYGGEENGNGDAGGAGACDLVHDDSTVGGQQMASLPTLNRGDSGAFVYIMQRRLLAMGYELPEYGADGDFGEETDKALRAMQRKLCLEIDGICGEQSWGAMLDH